VHTVLRTSKTNTVLRTSKTNKYSNLVPSFLILCFKVGHADKHIDKKHTHTHTHTHTHIYIYIYIYIYKIVTLWLSNMLTYKPTGRFSSNVALLTLCRKKILTWREAKKRLALDMTTAPLTQVPSFCVLKIPEEPNFRSGRPTFCKCVPLDGRNLNCWKKACRTHKTNLVRKSEGERPLEKFKRKRQGKPKINMKE